MAETLSVVTEMLPTFSTEGIVSFVYIIVIIIGFLALAGGFTWWLILFLKYGKKIKLYRKVGSRIMEAFNDKGMFARVGTGGDIWFVLRKSKKILPRPKLQAGKNLYYYYEREDGEWINFQIEDIDAVMKKAKAYFVDEDMRLQRLGIQKNLRDRFQKVSFWERYGGMIMSISFILVITICLVMVFKYMANNWAIASEVAQSNLEIAKAVENIARRIGGGAYAV